MRSQSELKSISPSEGSPRIRNVAAPATLIYKDLMKQKNRGIKKPERGLPMDVEMEDAPFRFPDSDVMDSVPGERPNVE